MAVRLCFGRPVGAGSVPCRGNIVQTAHPRDVGALALVVGLFLVLFVVSLTLGTPTR
jgi:hypothetical protein